MKRQIVGPILGTWQVATNIHLDQLSTIYIGFNLINQVYSAIKEIIHRLGFFHFKFSLSFLIHCNWTSFTSTASVYPWEPSFL